MISASAADAHRFGKVKRNGYDPAEVDAVVARLVDAIRKHEDKIEALERRLSEADVSAEAIRRTFSAAEGTVEAILTEARAEAAEVTEAAAIEADEVLGAARAEAGEIVSSANDAATRIGDEARASAERTAELANQVDIEVAAHRNRILAEAYDEAELMMLDVELSSVERVTASMSECDRAIESARARAARDREIGVASLRAAMIAAARIRGAASAAASAAVRSAETESAEIRAHAVAKADEAEARANHLRKAIAGLDEAARQLAQVTAEGISVIDLSRIEAAESDSLPASAPGQASIEDKWATRSAPPIRGSEVQSEDAPPDADGDEGESDHDEPAETFYQRSTGTPLSERVKIARRSG